MTTPDPGQSTADRMSEQRRQSQMAIAASVLIERIAAMREGCWCRCHQLLDSVDDCAHCFCGETEYRRRHEMDGRHFRTDCPQWPGDGAYELLYGWRGREQGMLCSQCRTKGEIKHFGTSAPLLKRASD